jgi:hypothetical protein
MKIEKILNKKNGKLIKNGISVTATLFDAELDELELSFDYSQSVNINTENLAYITLSIQNLYDMIGLIEKSEVYYEKLYKTN